LLKNGVFGENNKKLRGKIFGGVGYGLYGLFLKKVERLNFNGG
jgi:hypothetical protein